jgi:hypothetical protein
LPSFFRAAPVPQKKRGMLLMTWCCSGQEAPCTGRGGAGAAAPDIGGFWLNPSAMAAVDVPVFALDGIYGSGMWQGSAAALWPTSYGFFRSVICNPQRQKSGTGSKCQFWRYRLFTAGVIHGFISGLGAEAALLRTEEVKTFITTYACRLSFCVCHCPARVGRLRVV